MSDLAIPIESTPVTPLVPNKIIPVHILVTNTPMGNKVYRTTFHVVVKEAYEDADGNITFCGRTGTYFDPDISQLGGGFEQYQSVVDDVFAGEFQIVSLLVQMGKITWNEQ